MIFTGNVRILYGVRFEAIFEAVFSCGNQYHVVFLKVEVINLILRSRVIKNLPRSGIPKRLGTIWRFLGTLTF